MTDTAIYISITRGNGTLILDGDLILFGELLITLNDAARRLSQAENMFPNNTLYAEPKQEDGNVTS